MTQAENPPDAGPVAKITAAHIQQLGKSLVGQVYMVLRTVKIHDGLNQTVLVATEHLKDTLNMVWRTLGSVSLEFIEDQVYLNNTRLRMDAQSADNVKDLGQEFRLRGLGGLTFKRPVTHEGIRALMAAFTQVNTRAEDAALVMQERLAGLRDLAVEFLGPRTFAKRDDAPKALSIDPRLWALQTYAKAVMAVKRLVEPQDPLAGGQDPRLKITRIVQDLVDLAHEQANLLLRVCSIKDCTDYLYNHAVNVGVLSIALGRALGFSRTTLVDLGMAGIHADLGFSQGGLPAVLQKEELTPQDLEEVSQHPYRAVKLLLGKGAMSRGAMLRVITAFQHHVNYDGGGGYPNAAQVGRLHVFSRIVAVADCFDALTTNRAWREAFPPAEALQIMATEAGTKLDPALVKLLINLMGVYPLGTQVKLANGEEGVIYHGSSDWETFDKPVVKITHDAQGQPVARTLLRDLAEQDENGNFKQQLVGARSSLFDK